MNMNWLGFSLSPQDHRHAPISSDQLSDQQVLASRLGLNSDEISGGRDTSSGGGGGGSDFFDLSNSNNSSSTAASLNHHHLVPANSSFGTLEDAAAFNDHHIHSQDWNMRPGVGMNSSDSNNYQRTSSSDLSTMVMGSTATTASNSCSISHHYPNIDTQQQPKLENFLGQHSFADHHHSHHDVRTTSHDYLFDVNNGPAAAGAALLNNDSNNNNIGLSMIKTWLRNQPPAQPTRQDIGDDQQVENQVAVVKESRKAQSSSLSLSMSTGSLNNTAVVASGVTGENIITNSSKQSPTKTAAATTTGNETIEAVPRKSIDTFGQRTSIYRGVTRHRWTGRYEAHLWDNSCRREGQTRKGRQVYLGGYDKEDKAARAYDLAALKYWGTTTTTNFPISTYEKEIEEMKPMTRQEYVASLRRKSSGFSRGASIYRGVTRHHQHGRWQARIGRVAGNKDLYLGTFSTQEEAAEAYDIAAIKFRGLNAVTNFDMSRYDVKSILESSALPVGAGGNAKRMKDVEPPRPSPVANRHQLMITSVLDHRGQLIRSSSAAADHDLVSNIYSSSGSYGAQHAAGCSWPSLSFNQAGQPAVASNYAGGGNMQLHYSPYGYGCVPAYSHSQRVWCKQEEDTNTNSNQESSSFQLGSSAATHNFFHDDLHQQTNPNALMGLMDSSSAAAAASMEHSSGSNSVIYGDHHYHHSNSGYMIPMAMSTVVAHDDNNIINVNGYGNGEDHQEVNIKAQQLGYDQNVFMGSSCTTTTPDPAVNYRNLYYHLPVNAPSSDQAVVNTHHDQDGSISTTTCNMSWVPTAVPTLAHPTFTVWNDT